MQQTLRNFERCPDNTGRKTGTSFDNPALGYVPGNIAVISHLANTIKSNCTDPEVFRRVARYLETGKLESSCS